MIKNSIYSYEYSQPEDYKFSLDSVFLAQKVAQALKIDHPQDLSELKVLDLCAGSGVIGLELNFHLPEISKIDFLEIQDQYIEHFNLNKTQAANHSQFRFLHMNYEELTGVDHNSEFYNSYDVIVSNPPYFFMGEGLLSPNEFKNRCRFFIDSSFKKLIEAMLSSLKPNGISYFLVRPGKNHGRDILGEVRNLTMGSAAVDFFDEIRGTAIVRLIKKS